MPIGCPNSLSKIKSSQLIKRSKRDWLAGRYVYSVARNVERGDRGELGENSLSAHVGIEELIGEARRLKY